MENDCIVDKNEKKQKKKKKRKSERSEKVHTSREEVTYAYSNKNDFSVEVNFRTKGIKYIGALKTK